jgi:hypothetical protein
LIFKGINRLVFGLGGVFLEGNACVVYLRYSRFLVSAIRRIPAIGPKFAWLVLFNPGLSFNRKARTFAS